MSHSGLREIAEAVAREAGRQLREAFAGTARERHGQVEPDRSGVRGRPRGRAADPRAPRRGAAGRRLPGRGGRRRGRARRACAGSSTRSTGRSNFLFGIPQWAVSIACEDAEGDARRRDLRPDARRAVVGRARRHRRCSTARPVAASTRDDLATALVATGFGYDAEVRRLQADTVAAAAAAGARHPALRLGRARPGVDGRRPLRRLLRARAQAAGTVRPASCSACVPGWRCASSRLRRPPRAACSSRRTG